MKYTQQQNKEYRARHAKFGFGVCGAYMALGMMTLLLTTGTRTFNAVGVAHAADSETRAPIRQVDLRPDFSHYRLTIKRQGARDTCHVFTVVAALEYAVAQRYGRGVGLSEEYLNWAANQTSKQLQDGASFAELAQGLKRWGICEEEYMPYLPLFNAMFEPPQAAFDSAREIRKLNFRWHWIKQANDNPDDVTSGSTKIVVGDNLRDSHIETIKEVLRKGWPVCAGREHNVLIVGYRDDRQKPGGGTFTIRNSNHSNYRTMTYEEMKAKSNAVMWIDLPLKERATGDGE